MKPRDEKLAREEESPRDAFARIERLYRSEAPRLARRLRTRLSSAEEARDIVHDAFARLLGSRCAGSLREPEAFLNRVLRNLLIDRGRRRATRPVQVELNPECLRIRAEQEDAIEAEQLQERYRALVAALPARTREVFVLHRVDELGYKEIATRLGISVRTVEWHVAEAILRIGKGLDRR